MCLDSSQSRHLLSSSTSSLYRLPSRSYYPSTPAQHYTVANVLPLLATLPCLAIYALGRQDYNEKTKAFRRTLTGGADFEERLRRKRVKVRAERKEE